MTDRDSFIRAILSAYREARSEGSEWLHAPAAVNLFDTLAVFADWLEENHEPDLAFACRWAARRQRFPTPTPTRKYWQWSARRRGQHRPAYSHQLPPIVFNNMPAKFIVQTSPKRIRAKSVESAFAHLSRALAKIRKEVE